MDRMRWATISISVFIIFMSAGCGGYNKTIELEEGVNSQWAQVENQLKRRYDLIPNMVETVKGYATHEKELFVQIAEAHKAFTAAPDRDGKVAASQALEGQLGRVLLLRETYPELKANEGFLKFQDTLEGTENRIAVERKRYNDAVKELNTYIRGFPGSIYAGMSGVKEAKYFEVQEAEKAVPAVKF